MMKVSPTIGMMLKMEAQATLMNLPSQFLLKVVIYISQWKPIIME
jgi:hypothetical protein